MNLVTLKAVGRNGSLITNPRLELCLDFANTLYGRGGIPIESLHGFNDLVVWCGARGFLPQSEAARLADWARGDFERAASVFGEAIALREAIYRIFGNLASGGDAAAADLSLLNRTLVDAPARGVIARSAAGFGWRIESDRTTVAGLLAPVAWSAGCLLTGRYLERVRLCANQKCLWLFVDDSLGGARRWCSMRACGNRAKTQRHYLRRRAK